MNLAPQGARLNLAFTFKLFRSVVTSASKLLWLSLFQSHQFEKARSEFGELYSALWDTAEHSISHLGFNLPSALSDGPVNSVNALLCHLYGSRYASLSFGGSSGTLLTLLIGVLPKLQPHRDLILFDDACHQSTIGGIIFGRWKAVRFPRTLDPVHQTTLPLTCTDFISIVETHGPERFAAIVLVLPSYDGFRSPTEDRKIYAYARSKGITVIVDGAWDAVRFRQTDPEPPALNSICDVWITSPHKRGLTPSSLGCILTDNREIARLWDAALDLGFRSSSVSFVEIMIAEHRLQQIVSGDWNQAFSLAEESAKQLRDRVEEIHPDLYVVQVKDAQAEYVDPTHILINTGRIIDFDARKWAENLANNFEIDVEKATASTLLLLCASPVHAKNTTRIIRSLKESILMTITHASKAT